jgi:P-type E1-E2 ATPase
MGRPTLTDIHMIGGGDPSRMLSLVAALEAQSEHPLARAIVQAAVQRELPSEQAESFEVIPGKGVRGRVAGLGVEIGSPRYLVELGYELDLEGPALHRLRAAAKTPICVAMDGKLTAILGVADPIREDARTTIERLRGLGIAVAMITGDDRHTALAVAAELGLEPHRVISEVLPDGKIAALKQLRGDAGAVAFVGDGINDAPALAEADVGFAMGTGTDIAIDSADVVSMSAELGGVALAIGLSRATMLNIRQNLFWAFAYNASLIPIAAGVLVPSLGLSLSPPLAAAAMALSSVFVIGNAQRLRRFVLSAGPGRPSRPARTHSIEAV